MKILNQKYNKNKKERKQGKKRKKEEKLTSEYTKKLYVNQKADINSGDTKRQNGIEYNVKRDPLDR